MARKFKTPITLDELGSASSQAIAANVDGDSQNRINIDAGGKITWGSGSATGDTTLYRSAADTLKTDDAFTATSLAVTGQFTLPTSDGSADQVITTNGSGTLTWSDVSANATVSDTAPSSPATGQIWYESDTGKTFVYYDSFWIEVGASPPASPFITDLDEDTKIQVEESSDEDKIRFDTAGSERMIIDASGNVGIGTTSPDRTLHVDSGGVGIAATFQSSLATGGISLMGSGTTDDTRVRIGAEGDELKLFSNNVERVRIDSSGNVGIGTSSPSELLDINAGTAGSVELTTTGGRTIQLTANDSEPFLSVGSTSAHSAAIMTNGVRRLTVDSSGEVGIGVTSPSYKLQVDGQTKVGGGDDRTPDSLGDGHLMINGNGYTGFLSLDADGMWVGHNSGSRNLILAVDEQSRVQINSSGVVGVGTTTPGTQPGSNGLFYVESNSIPCNYYYNGTGTTISGWKFYSDVTGSQTLQALVRANGDFESRTNTYGATSDVAIKQDIVDAPSQWDDIKAVQLRKYRLIDDVTANGDDALVQLGVIAQELEAAGLGGLVVDADPDNDKPHKSVKYSVLLLKALGALQEAMARIEALEAN